MSEYAERQMPTALGSLPPKSGKKIQVIGAVLPRSGGNSFCAAVGYLLDGPAYHCGVECALRRDADTVGAWIEASHRLVHDTPEDKKRIQQIIKRELDGYVTTADPPLTQMIPELMEAFPDAVVICMTRSPESWAASITKAMGLMPLGFMKFALFWTPGGLSRLAHLFEAQSPIWQKRYGRQINSQADAVAIWHKHHDWLREIAPKDKLFFADVKDGWEPFCRALDVPVPDVPFPRLNDAKAIEDLVKGWFLRGLFRWALVFGGVASVAASLYWSPWRSL